MRPTISAGSHTRRKRVLTFTWEECFIFFLCCFPIRYIHNQNAHIEYFTCSPPGLEYDSPNPQKVDFADMDLVAFTKTKLGHGLGVAPTYVMLYSNLTTFVQSMFRNSYNLNYSVCSTHYHTLFAFDNVGERVDVLCLEGNEPRRVTEPEKYEPQMLVRVPFANDMWSTYIPLPISTSN